MKFCSSPTTAASLINCGVLKSGSPKDNDMMSFPCAFNSRLNLAMASVADSSMAFKRSDSLIMPQSYEL